MLLQIDQFTLFAEDWGDKSRLINNEGESNIQSNKCTNQHKNSRNLKMQSNTITQNIIISQRMNSIKYCEINKILNKGFRRLQIELINNLKDDTVSSTEENI